nr:putative RNA-directed DNA polymerase [Tanacetum cinerariifolium]
MQNHNTTLAEAPNISATPEHPVPDMISEVSSSQPNNLDNPQPDNLDENNADDIQDPTSEILQEHEKEALAVSLCSEEIPSSIEQALKSEKWKNTMDDEMKALKKNETWDQSAMPQGKKPVGCRWIFTVKYKPDGTVERYKARELKEEVYMEAPPGFSEHFKPEEACRLKKSLYGLKQSPRAWFGRFTVAMKRYGFKQSNSDHTLFLKNRKNRVRCLIIYVDDMVAHINAALRIVRCAGHGVLFRSNGHLNIQMYTDADWAGDKENKRSTSGYFSLVGGNLVTWRSKKQKVVSLSIAEAEFREVTAAQVEVSDAHELQKNIQVLTTPSRNYDCWNKELMLLVKVKIVSTKLVLLGKVKTAQKNTLSG